LKSRYPDFVEETYLRRAIALAGENVAAGGGPFGAVIVRAGTILAEGVNRVTALCDPTAHAEVTAIRAAGQALRTHDLSGCAIYTSCEPCPMCLGAILWARLDRIVFAATQSDAAAAGFDDSTFYAELLKPPAARRTPMRQALAVEGLAPLLAWRQFSAKVRY
jgi:tRNA(Arg) A34 adenosine deaminase TadA